MTPGGLALTAVAAVVVPLVVAFGYAVLAYAALSVSRSLKPTYRNAWRLVVPVHVVDILRTPWIQITRSRSHVDNRFECIADTERMVEVREVEHGVRVQVRRYSASWTVRRTAQIIRHEPQSTEYAVAK